MTPSRDTPQSAPDQSLPSNSAPAAPSPHPQPPWGKTPAADTGCARHNPCPAATWRSLTCRRNQSFPCACCSSRSRVPPPPLAPVFRRNAVAGLHLLQFHIRASHQPEALVARPLLLEVFREQVGVHLRRHECHAGFFFRQR